MAAHLGSPSAFPALVTIVSAAHAAVPAPQVMPALRLSMDGDSAPFASQLSELTDSGVDAWRPAAAGFRMPQSLRSETAMEADGVTSKDQRQDGTSGSASMKDQGGAGFSLPLAPRAETTTETGSASMKDQGGAGFSLPLAPRAETTTETASASMKDQGGAGFSLPLASRAETATETASLTTQDQASRAEIACETASASMKDQGGAGFSLPLASRDEIAGETACATTTGAIRARAVSTPKPGNSPAQKAPHRLAASTEGTPSTPIAVLPAPAPEIAATLPISTDELGNDDEPDIAVKAPVWRSAPSEPAEPVAPTVTAAASTVQPAQEMAFAARVQPVQSTAGSALPAEMASASAVASANKKVVAAVEDETATPADPHGLLAATSLERNAEPAAVSTPAASPSPRTEAPTPPPETQAKPSAPLKDISLQVTQPGRERVDVRVVQQGGEVHVSVHSADTGLTSGLRQGLSDLQSRLAENGYRSEMWRPGASASALAPAPAAQASTNQSRGEGQPQQGGSQQESGRRNQNQFNNQSNQPRWVEEMESSLGGREKSSGGFYGFSS
jgi:hypothetical protein